MSEGEDHSDGSDDAWIERELLRPGSAVFETDEILKKENFEEEITEKYSKIMGEDVKLELVTIEQMENSRDELVKAFQEEENLEGDAVSQLDVLRKEEREAAETLAKEEVRKLKESLYEKFSNRQKVRRRKCKEISDLARYRFRLYEDRLHMKLNRLNARLDPSRKDIDIRKRQWRLRWRKEPNLLNFRLVQLRSVGGKLPEGEYCVLISLYDCFGGNLLKYSTHAAKIKRSTFPSYHSGKHNEPNLFFDQLIQITVPSLSDLSLRMVILFEILHLKVFGDDNDEKMQTLISRSRVNPEGEGGRVVNNTVGWSVFPLVDNNKDFIRGFFKTCVLRGEMERTMDSFSDMEKKIKNNLDHWLGNLYFEVDYGGVDPEISSKEEYVLEVVQEGADEEDFEDDDENASAISDTDRSYYSPLQSMHSDMQSMHSDYFNPNELDEGIHSSYSLDKKKDFIPHRPGETIIEIEERDSSDDESEGEGEEEIEEEDDALNHTLMVREESERVLARSLLPVSEEPEHVQKKQLLLENPRIWFGQPQFGVIRTQRDKINADKEEIKKDVYEKVKGKVVVRQEQKFAKTFTATGDIVLMREKKEGEDALANPAMADSMYLSANFFSPFSNKARKLRNRENTQEGMEKPPDLLGMTLGQALWGKIKKTVDQTDMYPQMYEDNFEYDQEEYAMTRDRTQSTCTILDAQNPNNSLFFHIFRVNGISKMDLSLYKVAVKRKKFHWNQKSVYTEKLKFVSKFTLIDMGLSDYRSFRFFLMMFLVLAALFLVRFPHYLGQWFWLSFFKVSFRMPPQFKTPFYLRFAYKTEFQSTLFNFGYVVAGTIFNILISIAIVVFLWISRKLFRTLPLFLYRFASLFIFAVAVDPLLFFFQDLIMGLIWPDEVPYGEAFVLPDYYKNTEGSELPGILLSVAVMIPVMAIQFFLCYQFSVHLNMNCRIMDIYKRLNKPERKFFIPHDLETSKKELNNIVGKSKQMNQIGSAKQILTSVIKENLDEIKILQRLNAIIDAVLWPQDYINFCRTQQENLGLTDYPLVIPAFIHEDKRPSAVLHRETMIGKLFVIRNFPNLIKFLLFDDSEFDKLKKRQKIIDLFKKFGIVHNLLLDRLKKNKVTTAHIPNTCIRFGDVDTVMDNTMEMDIPTFDQVIHEREKSWKNWLFQNIYKPIKWRLLRGKPRVVPITDSSMNQFIGGDEEQLLPSKSKSEKQEEKDKVSKRESDRCLHVQILVKGDTGRLANHRNFVQTADGTICEVFSRARNQLSNSDILRRGSVDFWIHEVEKKVIREGMERRRKYNKRLMNIMNRNAFARGLMDALKRKRKRKIVNSSM